MRDLQQFIDEQPGVDKTLSLLDYLGVVRRVLQPERGALRCPSRRARSTSSSSSSIQPTSRRWRHRRLLARQHHRARATCPDRRRSAPSSARVEDFARERLPRGIEVRAHRQRGAAQPLGRRAGVGAGDRPVAGAPRRLFLLLSLLFLSIRVGVAGAHPERHSDDHPLRHHGLDRHQAEHLDEHDRGDRHRHRHRRHDPLASAASTTSCGAPAIRSAPCATRSARPGRRRCTSRWRSPRGSSSSACRTSSRCGTSACWPA